MATGKIEVTLKAQVWRFGDGTAIDFVELFGSIRLRLRHYKSV
jgi:hypothetical protein